MPKKPKYRSPAKKRKLKRRFLTKGPLDLNSRVKKRTKDFAKKLRKHPTRGEAALWRELRGAKIGGVWFKRQYVIRGWIADFYAPKPRLVVEVDGPSHWTKAGRERDAFRDRTMQDLGLTIVRVTNEEVLETMPLALVRIRAALVGR